MHVRFIAAALLLVLVGAGCAPKPPPATEPARIVADFSSGKVTLMGSLPNAAAHARLLSRARQVYGEAHVLDQVGVDAKVIDAPWISTDLLVLPLVDKGISEGQSAFDGKQLILTGEVPSQTIRSQISERAAKACGKRHRHRQPPASVALKETLMYIRTAIAVGLLTMAASSAGALDLGALTNSDASAGLKKALDQGITQAVSKLGTTDGFFKNPTVKIPLPPKLAKAESMMRMLGMGKQADELVESMNRAAEAAVPESKVLLKQALTKMSVADAKQILTGGDDSATQYFKRVTSAQLQEKFKPIVTRATQKVKLAQQYNTVAGKGVELGLLKAEDASIESYVTQKTLDGLYLMIADEERAIRKDPLGQASSLLKKVFGAIH